MLTNIYSKLEVRVVLALREIGTAATFDLTARLRHRRETINFAIKSINQRAGQELITCFRDGKRTKKPLYKLRDDVAAMPAEEITKAMAKPPPCKSKHKGRFIGEGTRAWALAQNPVYVTYMRKNAPYMSCTQIARACNERMAVIADLAILLGISLEEKDREPRHLEIAADLPHIPVEAEVVQWLGGTCIHLPSDTHGITRVTRHYAADE